MSIFSAMQITFEEVHSKLLGSCNLLDYKLLETYQSSLLQSSRKAIAISSVVTLFLDITTISSIAILLVAYFYEGNLWVAYLSEANLLVANLSITYL